MFLSEILPESLLHPLGEMHPVQSPPGELQIPCILQAMQGTAPHQEPPLPGALCTARKGKSCSHMVRRCPNCEETSHFVGDRHCATRIRARSPTTAEKGKAPKRAHTPPP